MGARVYSAGARVYSSLVILVSPPVPIGLGFFTSLGLGLGLGLGGQGLGLGLDNKGNRELLTEKWLQFVSKSRNHFGTYESSFVILQTN